MYEIGHQFYLILLGQFVKSNFVVVRVEEDAQPVGREHATAGALGSGSLEIGSQI